MWVWRGSTVWGPGLQAQLVARQVLCPAGGGEDLGGTLEGEDRMWTAYDQMSDPHLQTSLAQWCHQGGSPREHGRGPDSFE